jgi:uncharacterized RDD family membrane protein YckC
MSAAASPLDNAVAIETPEHIIFHYRVAGPVRRCFAYLLDLLICYGALFVLALLLVVIAVGGGFGEMGSIAKAMGGFFLVLLFAIQWVYFVVWDALRGRSPGKAAFGLRVVTTTGRPIGWRAAALRNLLRAADALPTAYLVGVVAMALNSRFQRLGDLVAGTMVIVPEDARAAKPLELHPPAWPQELATLPDEVILDADERIAIEMVLRRRHSHGRAREHELACMIAGPIAQRLGFRHEDPARLLAIVYDRAVNVGRTEAPPSSWHPRVKHEEEEDEAPPRSRRWRPR